MAMEIKPDGRHAHPKPSTGEETFEEMLLVNDLYIKSESLLMNLIDQWTRVDHLNTYTSATLMVDEEVDRYVEGHRQPRSSDVIGIKPKTGTLQVRAEFK
ncbi:hypothetical protein KEM48_001268 [Puccinia striiformis f. sp. tritici PST-130]|nr:hypothetical protein KEM48_001268 [Puccinia striiformis f. sp. tritici PST-130]